LTLLSSKIIVVSIHIKIFLFSHVNTFYSAVEV